MRYWMSKLEWKLLSDGKVTNVRFFKESDLRHYFGDHPEEDVVEVEVQEATGVA